MVKFLWKGDIVGKDDMDIDVFDRGYNFGDGIYEFIRVYNGNFFELEAHLQRLYNSAKMIEMKMPFSFQELEEMCQKLIEANNVISGHIYFQITRGDGMSRSHAYEPIEEQHPVISGFTSSYERPLQEIYVGGKASLFPDLRGFLCNAKTLNLLPNCMAIADGKRRGFNKAIMYRNELVTEERAGNVFIIKDGEVITTPDGPGILPGITKKVVLQILKEKNIPFRERNFSVKELKEADEVIVTDSKHECYPIFQVEDVMIGTGGRGEITAKIESYFEEKIIEQCQGL